MLPKRAIRHEASSVELEAAERVIGGARLALFPGRRSRRPGLGSLLLTSLPLLLTLLPRLEGLFELRRRLLGLLGTPLRVDQPFLGALFVLERKLLGLTCSLGFECLVFERWLDSE